MQKSTAAKSAPLCSLPLLLFFPLFTAAAPIDFSLCNQPRFQSGGRLEPSEETIPFFEFSAKGSLQLKKDHPRAFLISKRFKQGELAFFEFRETASSLAGSLAAEKLSRTLVRLRKENGLPAELEIERNWIPSREVSGSDKPEANTWPALKKKLGRAKKLKGRKALQWSKLSYSADRCYVSEEGFLWKGTRVVAFDHALCAEILRLAPGKSSDLTAAWKSADREKKSEARRILQLIRGAIVRKNESLLVHGQQLMAAGIAPPESALPGMMPQEELSALRELRHCENQRALENAPVVYRGHEGMEELQAPPDPSR